MGLSPCTWRSGGWSGATFIGEPPTVYRGFPALAANLEHSCRITAAGALQSLAASALDWVPGAAPQQSRFARSAAFRCVYRLSICRDLCPVIEATSIMFSPLSKNRLVASWRRS